MEDVNLQEAGRLMRRLRESHGWTNRRLFAERIGAKESTLRKYETGEGKRPDRAQIERVARALGSRDGARLLFAYGLDTVAQRVAAADIDPLEFELDLTIPASPDLTEKVDDMAVRVDHIEELLGEIVDYLRRSEAPISLDARRPKGGYVSAGVDEDALVAA